MHTLVPEQMEATKDCDNKEFSISTAVGVLKKQTQIFQKPPSTFSFFFIFQLSLPFSNVLVFRIFKNLLNFIFLGYLIAKLQQDSFTKAKEREKRKHTEKSKWRQNEKAAITKKYHRIKS